LQGRQQAKHVEAQAVDEEFGDAAQPADVIPDVTHSADAFSDASQQTDVPSVETLVEPAPAPALGPQVQLAWEPITLSNSTVASAALLGYRRKNKTTPAARKQADASSDHPLAGAEAVARRFAARAEAEAARVQEVEAKAAGERALAQAEVRAQAAVEAAAAEAARVAAAAAAEAATEAAATAEREAKLAAKAAARAERKAKAAEERLQQEQEAGEGKGGSKSVIGKLFGW
jgi:hypothetical protein